MSNYHYVQYVGGEEHWTAIPVSQRYHVLTEQRPNFMTALSVSKLVEDLPHDEKMKLLYAGDLYLDWDSKDETLVIEKVNQFLDKFEEMGFDLGMCRLFATGGKGYHMEVPMACFMEKVPKAGVMYLPMIYREMALTLCVDTLDMKIYSAGRGRMWRCPGNKRENGRYKVPLSVAEMREMTPELCHLLTANDRQAPMIKAPEFCLKLSILYDRCVQKVEQLMKARGKMVPDPRMREKAGCHSIKWMMAGIGIAPGAGFQQVATQLAIAACATGLGEDAFIQECQGLIASHQSDGDRYNTEGRRAEELRRMHRYMDGNMCYEFSVGAIKKLLMHSAPDLDGIAASKEDVKEVIEEAQDEVEGVQDEYGDVAKGITLAKFGAYKATEFGQKRICAISFANTCVLKSAESCQIVGYEADILVNGVRAGRQTLETDIFQTLVQFNRFAAKYGHAFQGTDAEVRTMMMRFVEQSKKSGEVRYIVNREGLDLINIPNHENPLFHEPFLVWADSRGVVSPLLKSEGLELAFAGFPDHRGVFRTDITDAPNLVEWVSVEANKHALYECLKNLMSCQRPELLGKLIGWYTACFWKQLFQKAYHKFPLLHVNGSAGAGKCLGRDTPVLLASGVAKMVQDIRVGDQLLGPDGGVRKVLSICTGRETLYRVTPIKGDSYVVNASHILSMKKSEKPAVVLADGTYVPENADIVNVNVETYLASNQAARKTLKGWRSDALEFQGEKQELLLDPYWLGAWLGDGASCGPQICKPEDTELVRWWKGHAQLHGHGVTKYHYREGECPSWNITAPGWPDVDGTFNVFTDNLRRLKLIGNKHIPDRYKFASLPDRLKLLAGMLDSDGHLTHSNFDWITNDEQMAKDFAFVCRSVGLAAYIKPCVKRIKSTNFEGNYWRVSVSGDTDKIPCLDKRAQPREQIKRVTVTGITAEPIGEGDYYGFELDGDKLFLLGDFTVTHNTEMNTAIASMYYYRNDPKVTSPGSTTFSLGQFASGSSSIPLIIDEYKPHEMTRDMHNRIKLMLRDAYNQHEMTRGGGNRESEDYRRLQYTQLAAPLAFIAEATESEAAVMERVVLATVVRPPYTVGQTWLSRFEGFKRNKHFLGILGKYIAAQIVHETTIDSFAKEFDAMYTVAKDRFLVTQSDLDGGISDEELKNKQGAKERSVYNHTVAKFGMAKFRELVNSILGYDYSLDEMMGELEDGIYDRMSDLREATTPEYVKVLKDMSAMSYLEKERLDALRIKEEYALSANTGRDCIEIAIRTSYFKYRTYMRNSGLPALYGGYDAFAYALKDSPAYVKQGIGDTLMMPGVFVFDVTELQRLGVDMFKEK